MRSVVLTSLLLSFLVLAGCGSSQAILGTIGNEKIPLKEYEEMYVKNNGGWEKAAASTLQDRKNFLDLFVKYKLKLLEAEDLGLERDTAVVKELEGYRTSMATSYVLERELIEPGVKDLYNRRKFDLRASHILIRVSPTATPADTLAAYLKAKNLIDRAQKVSFDSLAHSFSEDPGSAANGGDLGWFSQGRMVKEFEDASYSLQPGGITREPVRTRFGYHIIKLTGRRPYEGAVGISHILKRFSPDQSDTSAVKDTVWAVYRQLKAGTLSFEDAARVYSDDPSSKQRGGALGSYGRSGVPPEIGDIFFSTPIDSIPPPFRAPYGFHIFKITGKSPLPPYETARQELRQQYQQSQYSPDYDGYLAGLHERYHLNYDVKLRDELRRSFDSTKTAESEGWSSSIKHEWLAKPLMTFEKETLSVAQLLHDLEAGQEFRVKPLTVKNVDEAIDRIADSKLLTFHTMRMTEKDPEFGKLMIEYKNGVLLYQLEQDEVWNKLDTTEAALRTYYEANRKKYIWPMHVNFAEIFVKSEQRAESLYTRLMAGEDFGELAARYTERAEYKKKKGEWGYISYKTNDLAATAIAMFDDSISTPISFEGGWSIIKKLGRQAQREETFEEALPEVRSHYQSEATKLREQAWIDGLRKKYGVTIDESMLPKAFQKAPREGS